MQSFNDMGRLRLPLLLIVGLGLVSASDVQDGNAADYERMMLKLRRLSVEFFDYYDNLTITDLIVPDGRLANEQDESCLAELTELRRGLASGSLWALRMIDSWGGLPSGVLLGNLKDLGNYDECMRVRQVIDPSSSSSHILTGKYCFAKPVPILQTAVCFPATCTVQHMDALLRRLFQHLFNIEINAGTQLIDDNSCQTAAKEPLDGLTIFTIVLLGVLMAALLLCTAYDYCICGDQRTLPILVKLFSARVNSRALFRIVDSKTNPNVIDCLHGIRCMSLIWVVYGHDFTLIAALPNINTLDLQQWLQSPYSMFVVHGLFAVDTFFFLSGLLVVMVSLRTMDKTKGKLNVLMMYLHRYLRLTPILLLAILVFMKILPLMGSGPLASQFLDANIETCQEDWYWTFLYIQNYAGKSCLGHSWYLAVDMQLYIISPLLLIALYKWGKKAVAGIVVIMLLLAACLFSMMVIKGYSMHVPNNIKIYVDTHVRASPWIIGMIFGYYLYMNRGKTFHLNRLVVWLGWICSLALLFTCLFALYPYSASGRNLPILNEAFYVTFSRMAWPLALVWVVFACKHGYGGLANSFLASPLWQPLSKLSYCAYIWHVFIQGIHAGNTRTSGFFSDYEVMLRFWSDFGFTVLFAYFMYVLVEAPSAGLELMLTMCIKRKPEERSAVVEPRIKPMAWNEATVQLEEASTRL